MSRHHNSGHPNNAQSPWGHASNTAPEAAPAATTTARELKLELSRYANALEETGSALQSQLRNVSRDCAQLDKEVTASITDFVGNELDALESERFERFAALAKNTPELTSADITYLRRTAVSERTKALADLNDKTGGAYDETTFEQAYADLDQQYQRALARVKEANEAGKKAAKDQKEWQDSDEGILVALDDDLRKKNEPSLSPDSRSHYEPNGFFQSIYWYLTKGPAYREVRTCLKGYGHGTGGKDVFADMKGFRSKRDAMAAAIVNSKAEISGAENEVTRVKATLRPVNDAREKILTDEQILDRLREKAVEYFETPAFVNAAMKEYGEDFPADVPLKQAKISMLTKLRAGINSKLEILQGNYQSTTDQRRQLERVAPQTQVGVDIDAYRRYNDGRLTEYRNYTRAAEDSHNRTVTYNPPVQERTVYVDNGPSLIEIMMWDHILNGDRHRDRDSGSSHRYDTPAAPLPDTAPYSADLLGLTREQAAEYKLPDSVFETSDSLKDLMRDAGVSDYSKPGDILGDWSLPAAAGNDGSSDLGRLIEEASLSDRFSRSAENTDSDTSFREEASNSRSSSGLDELVRNAVESAPQRDDSYEAPSPRGS